VTVPPLRERKEDIPALVDHFVQLFCKERGRIRLIVPDEMMNLLRNHPWPGNVRRLRQLVEMSLALNDGETITSATVDSLAKRLEVEKQWIPSATAKEGWDTWEQQIEKMAGGMYSQKTYEKVVEELEERLLRAALLANGGNAAATARAIGMHPNTLKDKMKRLGIR
jgi:two-component system nitrogen regulation response regulator GlnG